MTITFSRHYYLEKFSACIPIKTVPAGLAVTTHRAPHKPLLLLAVLDLFAQGSLTTNLIELSPELGELFTTHWHTVRPPSQRGILTYPFYYLQSDGFWHLQPRLGQKRPWPSTAPTPVCPPCTPWSRAHA
ncbi:MAG: hypothetical protein H6659_19450 [Ardenticatenaceae bacterium]|nr:hypothetical protein [Ardenticatenaceae bacterium]